jgi:hypothetical protein
VNESGDRWMIQAIDHLIEKTAHEKLLGHRQRNPAREKVEHLVFVDLAGSRAVAALHVVGQNLEARHRICLRIIAQQEIPDRLVGIGEMGVRFDPDEAAESVSGAIVQRFL